MHSLEDTACPDFKQTSALVAAHLIVHSLGQDQPRHAQRKERANAQACFAQPRMQQCGLPQPLQPRTAAPPQRRRYSTTIACSAPMCFSICICTSI